MASSPVQVLFRPKLLNESSKYSFMTLSSLLKISVVPTWLAIVFIIRQHVTERTLTLVRCLGVFARMRATSVLQQTFVSL